MIYFFSFFAIKKLRDLGGQGVWEVKNLPLLFVL